MEKYHLLKTESAAYINPYHRLDASDISEEDSLEKQLSFGSKEPPFYKRHATSVLVHLLLVSVNLAVCLGFLSWTNGKYPNGPGIRYTPARAVIELEERRFDMVPTYLENGTMNPDKPTRFTGLPSEELDAAWNELIQYQNIRLSKDELGERGQEEGLIELPDSGYYATMTVYHALHCVKRLHHFIYLDHYYPNLTGSEHVLLMQHAEHCLDTLRQNIQCGADTTIIPLEWGTQQRIPLGSDTGRHECANWEKLDGWMKERSFNPMAPGYLSHPHLGLAFPNGVGEKFGVVADTVLGGER